jgi:DNA-binding transcriptional MerR regulator
MYAIAALARCSGLSRRAIQFWADKEILQPLRLFAETKRRHYSRTELEIVRLLRPFHAMAVPVNVIHLLALVFREQLLTPETQTAFEHEEFGPLVDAARQGKPAYLGVQISASDVNSFGCTAALHPAPTAKDVASLVTLQLEEVPLAPMVFIDLTEALHEPDKAIQRRLAALRALDEMER